MASSYSEYLHPKGSSVASTHDEVMEAWTATMRVRHAILAHEVAARRPDVIAFRETYLPDGLIDPADDVVGAWIACEIVRSDAFEGDVQPHDPRYRKTLVGLGSDRDESGRLMPVPIVIAMESDVFETRSRPYLAMGDLSKTAEALRAEFGWTSASAARWLIARDAIPDLPTIRAGLEFRSSKSEADPRWSANIQITVPIDFPPSRLQREFERIQREYADIYAFDVPAGKPASISNLRRTLFAVQHNDGRTWSEVVEAWNEAHVAEAIPLGGEEARTFAGTVRRTYKNIMDRPIEWKRVVGSR